MYHYTDVDDIKKFYSKKNLIHACEQKFSKDHLQHTIY